MEQFSFIVNIVEIVILTYLIYIYVFRTRECVSVDCKIKCPKCGVYSIFHFEKNKPTKCSVCENEIFCEIDLVLVSVK